MILDKLIVFKYIYNIPLEFEFIIHRMFINFSFFKNFIGVKLYQSLSLSEKIFSFTKSIDSPNQNHQ